jgi:hypothetical protein
MKSKNEPRKINQKVSFKIFSFTSRLSKKKYCYTNIYTQKAKKVFLRIVYPQKYILRVIGNSL